jgi:hypothetical protein
MTRADNSAFLTQANTRRHEAALAAAHHAINQLRREGKLVSYAAVAHSAGVSRGLALPPGPDPRPHQPATRTPPAASRRAARNQRLTPPAARHRPDRDQPPAEREPLPPRPDRPQPRPPASTTHRRHAEPIAMTPTTTNPHGCGSNMSTPQKHRPTRQNTTTAPDNRLTGDCNLNGVTSGTEETPDDQCDDRPGAGRSGAVRGR